MDRVTRSLGLHRKRRIRQPSPPPGFGVEQHLHSKRPKASSPKTLSVGANSPGASSGSARKIPTPTGAGADTAHEEKKKKRKVREKRTQLDELVRQSGLPDATATAELRRWNITASIRRTGNWIGGVELSYRLGTKKIQAL